MASLCHPWFTTTNLSYRFPIFETSATALCGTTGNLSFFMTRLEKEKVLERIYYDVDVEKHCICVYSKDIWKGCYQFLQKLLKYVGNMTHPKGMLCTSQGPASKPWYTFSEECCLLCRRMLHGGTSSTHVTFLEMMTYEKHAFKETVALSHPWRRRKQRSQRAQPVRQQPMLPLHRTLPKNKISCTGGICPRKRRD